jgi:Xaa-Pro aminopeptidase
MCPLFHIWCCADRYPGAKGTWARLETFGPWTVDTGKLNAAARTMTPPQPFYGRLEQLRIALFARKADAALVIGPHDQFYLTGFTGQDGAAMVTRKAVWLLTDGRFKEQARKEAPWARTVIRKVGLAQAAGQLAGRLRIGKILVQPEVMTLEEAAGLQKHLPKSARLIRASGVIRKMRVTKDSAEIDRIRAAIRVGEEAFEVLRRRVRPGMTESQVAATVEYEMRRRGASGPAFATIAAVDANAALPHYRAGEVRVPKNGLLLVDWGARLDEYCGDLTRVLLIGRIPARIRRLYQAVLDAQLTAIAAIRPGIPCRQVDLAARRVLDRAGLGRYFVHGVGHGLGLEVHEPPRLAATSKDRLEPGMVVTVEPGVYLPGQAGIRIEDDVVVTGTGCQLLSRLPKRIEWATIR